MLGVGSLAAGFGAGLWWLGRDTSPESARWVLTHSARSAQLTPASQGLFTLTMSPADAQVIAVRLDDPGSSHAARRLESEWETMFGDESITLTLLVHDATIDADPDAHRPTASRCSRRPVSTATWSPTPWRFSNRPLLRKTVRSRVHRSDTGAPRRQTEVTSSSTNPVGQSGPGSSRLPAATANATEATVLDRHRDGPRR